MIKKILIVAPYFYPKMGGVEKYIYEICSYIRKKYSCEICVICTNWNYDDNNYREEIIDNIKIYRLPFLFKLSSTPINPSWINKIEQIVSIEKPDLINGHIPVPIIADIAARVSHKNRIPFVLTYHNDIVGYNLLIRSIAKLYYFFIGNKTLYISNLIHATSDYYVQSSPYLKRFINKIAIVSPGVNINQFKVKKSNFIREKHHLDDERIVLFVGQLNKASKHKGLNNLIKSIKIVNEEFKSKLIIIGKGDYIHYYKTIAKNIGIEKDLIFTGFVKDQELIEYYTNSDVMVLPSNDQSEGFGMVLIEAQACGTPVIGTNVGGIPYAIENGKTGLIVPPKDVNQLAKSIIYLFSNDEISKKMSNEGIKRTNDFFTWDKSGDDFIESLKTVISR